MTHDSDGLFGDALTFDLDTNDTTTLCFSLGLLQYAQLGDMTGKALTSWAEGLASESCSVHVTSTMLIPGLPNGMLAKFNSGALDDRLLALIAHESEDVANYAARLLINRKDGYAKMLDLLLGKLDDDVEIRYEEDRAGSVLIGLASGSLDVKLTKRKYAYRYQLLAGRADYCNDVYTALREKLRAEAPIDDIPAEDEDADSRTNGREHAHA